MKILPVLLASTFVVAAVAQPPPAKRLPPAGVAIPEKDRTELTAGAAALAREIDVLRTELKANPDLLALLPDVEIFHKAVDWALRYDEFFNVKQTATARTALQQGTERAQQLRSGKAPWTEATGLVVRGYRSKIDGSVQPYGLTVPATWRMGDANPRRFDVWLLGRGETRTELAFLAERTKPAPFEPEDAIVLTPYGRYCNATKFAGEVDVLEAMDAVKKQFAIDPQRIVVRGFSMGGASTWHLATHHPGVWCAAAPGAGFAETPNYAGVFAPGKDFRPWWEQLLWRWYNATDYAANLFNVPTVAYSGELDKQKAAAETMVAAAAAEGVRIEHLIGPKTEHKYEPNTKKQLAARIDMLAAKGRDETPKEIHFATYTLKYPECAWIRIEGLQRHWERAEVHAQIVPSGAIKVETRNVSALTIKHPARGGLMLDDDGFGGESVPAATYVKVGRTWKKAPATAGVRKTPGLQGPIDDAFMAPFVFARPTGKPLNDTVGQWVQAEFDHAVKMWRDIFRGDAPVKDDRAITDEDVANANLVLWGDSSSNALLARMLPKLPLKWDSQTLEFRGYKLDAAHHAPIFIFPNPLNPSRYVVLNSGVTFREEAYGTNSLQTPKLPDWAIIDLRTPPGLRWPGLVYDAGFFDEQWR
jgi:dienelactone hydrolase